MLPDRDIDGVEVYRAPETTGRNAIGFITDLP
jgi:hypothetical protein